MDKCVYQRSFKLADDAVLDWEAFFFFFFLRFYKFLTHADMHR